MADGFGGVQATRWFFRGSIAESMHWVVLHGPVEVAAFIRSYENFLGSACRFCSFSFD